MDKSGVERLMAAVVGQAYRDYKTALFNYHTKRRREDIEKAKNMIDECELFFRKNCSAFTSISGEKIMKEARLQVEKDLARRGIKMKVIT